MVEPITEIVPGSVPGVVAKEGAPPAPGEVGKESPTLDENVPWNKDPRFQKFLTDRKELMTTTEKLKVIMADNEVEDIEELKDLITSGKKVHGKVDLETLDAIVAKATKLDEYEEYWAQKAEADKRAGEEPDETVARVTKENEELKRRLDRQSLADEGGRALKEYDNAVTLGVKDLIPNYSDVKFALEFLGVDNPAVKVEITNKAAVSKMVRDQVKKLEKHDQQVIKDYLAGKGRIPEIPKVGDGALPDTGEIKNLKQARKVFHSLYK